MQDAYDQTGIFADEEEDRGFGAVAALYTETCQVVVRADSDIRSIEDLQGRTVSIGAEESGSEQNALQILSAYGLNDKMVSMVNLNYEDAAAQLKAGRVDAIFMTVGAPVRCGTGGSLQLHLPVVRLVFQCCEPLTELPVDAALASHTEAQPFGLFCRCTSAQNRSCQQNACQCRREPLLFQDHHSSSCRRSAAELLP